jgi:hypothetical protein
MADSTFGSISECSFPSFPKWHQSRQDTDSISEPRAGQAIDVPDSLVPLIVPPNDSVEALSQPASNDVFMHLDTIYARTKDMDSNYETICHEKPKAFSKTRENIESISKRFAGVLRSPATKEMKELFEQAIRGLEECLIDSADDGLSPKVVVKAEEFRRSWLWKTAPPVDKTPEEGIAFWLLSSRYNRLDPKWDDFTLLSWGSSHGCNINLSVDHFKPKLQDFYKICRIYAMKQKIGKAMSLTILLDQDIDEVELLLCAASMQNAVVR